MAKVRLPLGSFGARGQIGKAFVYFPWKGIACVREYIIPANPNTAGQQTQRGYFTTAVDEYHAIGYTAVDITAWRLLAAQSKNPLTYFNVVVREHVNVLIEGDAWTPLSGCEITSVATTSFDVKLLVSADKTGKLYWGTTPGYMPNEVDGVFSLDHYDFELTGLPIGTRIYFYAKNTIADFQGRTGIYLQKTASA